MAMLTATLHVRPYRQTDSSAWDQYVNEHPSATLFHRLAWSRAVESAYHHRPVHLTVWEDERLAGILPLFLVKSIFVGKVLVSVPYGTYGGILADSDEAAKCLMDAAGELSRQFGARYVEFRHREPSGLELPCVDRYDTFRKRLPDRVEDVLDGLPRKARAAAQRHEGSVRGF